MTDVSNREAKMARPSRAELYMETARLFAQRSTCNRKAVGAVLVRGTLILGIGYNGAARDKNDCLSDGCLIMDSHCVRTVHAEVNAILMAARNGISTEGATMYTTTRPCHRCVNFLINAGVKYVLYDEDYDDGLNRDLGMLEVMQYVPRT